MPHLSNIQLVGLGGVVVLLLLFVVVKRRQSAAGATSGPNARVSFGLKRKDKGKGKAAEGAGEPRRTGRMIPRLPASTAASDEHAPIAPEAPEAPAADDHAAHPEVAHEAPGWDEAADGLVTAPGWPTPSQATPDFAAQGLDQVEAPEPAAPVAHEPEAAGHWSEEHAEEAWEAPAAEQHAEDTSSWSEPAPHAGAEKDDASAWTSSIAEADWSADTGGEDWSVADSVDATNGHHEEAPVVAAVATATAPEPVWDEAAIEPAWDVPAEPAPVWSAPEPKPVATASAPLEAEPELELESAFAEPVELVDEQVVEAAPAYDPVARWAAMAPVVREPERPNPAASWARLRPASTASPAPLVVPVLPREDVEPAEVAEPAPGQDDPRHGRFALGGYALQAGHQVVSGVTFRAGVEEAPTSWAVGPADNAPAGTLVLDVDGCLNCGPEDITVLTEAGFAPTSEGFSVRLTARDGGPFAASGRYTIR